MYLVVGFCLLPLAFGDFAQGQHRTPIRRVDIWDLSHRERSFVPPPHPRPLRHVKPFNPLRGLFHFVDQSRRRSQNLPTRLIKRKGYSRPRSTSSKRKPLPPHHRATHFIHVNANQLPGYQESKLHDYIRKQEGTEIFDGRKDHVNKLVMHYVEAPEIISTTDYGNAIDKKTAKTDISAEEADKDNAIQDTVVGFIGANKSQKFAL